MTRPTFSQIRLPGIPAPDPDGPWDLTLKPGTPRIAHASFEPEAGTGLPIGADAQIAFTICSPVRRDGTAPMTADIVGGDYGFATVNIQNARGTILRFARGNMKDFFDISRPDEPQRVQLSVASFVYDRDNKQNVPLEGNFFDAPVTKLYFDFLRHPEREIDIHLADIAVVQSGGSGDARMHVQDLVIFERTGQARQLPKFSTRTDRLSFGLSLTNAGLAAGLKGAAMTLSVANTDGTDIDRKSLTLKEENTYLALSLPQVGAYRLRAEITQEGQVPVVSDWPVARLPTGGGALCGLADRVGISDEYQYDRIAALGGGWDRLVIRLSDTVADGDGFRFGHGLESLPAHPVASGHARVLAPFAMPKRLSRRSDIPDYYRYGAADWDEFERLVGWLATRAARAGVTHYETWNELTALGHWAGGMDDAMRIHEVTARAVRRAAPGMKILGGCTHSWVASHLSDFLSRGGADHCDGLAVHGYTYQAGDWDSQFGMVEGLLERHCPNRPDFRACITEMGFRTPAFSEKDQAYWFALYTLETMVRARFESILWFRYTNPRPEIASGYRQSSSTGYALVGHNDSYCRPALVAYALMIDTLGRCDRITRTASEETTYAGWHSDRAAVLFDTGRTPEVPDSWHHATVPGRDTRCLRIAWDPSAGHIENRS